MKAWLNRWRRLVSGWIQVLVPGRPGRRYPVTGHEPPAAVRRALLAQAIRELKGLTASREGMER